MAIESAPATYVGRLRSLIAASDVMACRVARTRSASRASMPARIAASNVGERAAILAGAFDSAARIIPHGLEVEVLEAAGNDAERG